jgi:hypothetical protein
MQVLNSTPQGTRYTVTGGGTGTPITPPEGSFILSGYLKPGETAELAVKGAGPWKVSFEPDDGSDRVGVAIYDPKDCAQLCLRSGMLCTETMTLAADPK